MCTVLFSEPLEVICTNNEIPDEAVSYCFDVGTLPLQLDNSYTLIGLTYYHNTHKIAALLEEYHDVKLSWDIKWLKLKGSNKSLYSLVENSGWNPIEEYKSKNN